MPLQFKLQAVDWKLAASAIRWSQLPDPGAVADAIDGYVGGHADTDTVMIEAFAVENIPLIVQSNLFCPLIGCKIVHSCLMEQFYEQTGDWLPLKYVG